MKQKAHGRSRDNTLLVTLLSIIGVLVTVGILTTIPILYDRHETYRDRPLADRYEYVGRDYQSGCLAKYVEVKIFCHFTQSEEYFYATDISPKELANNFPDWEFWDIDHKEGDSFYSKSNDRMDVDIYSIRKEGYGLLSYRAYPDSSTVTKVVKLKPTDKHYLLSMSPAAYAALTGRPEENLK